MKITTGRIALAAALAAGIPLVAAGCGDSTQATTTEVLTETTAPAPAATTAAVTPAATSALPAAPSGAKQLASRQKNGATYYH